MTTTKSMSLEMRRLRSDLIDVCMIMHNFEGIKREYFFPLAQRRSERTYIYKFKKFT